MKPASVKAPATWDAELPSRDRQLLAELRDQIYASRQWWHLHRPCGAHILRGSSTTV